MVKVFVFGATGFIGGAISTALRRAGHNVYGLVRDSSKSKTLAAQEITPIVGEISKPDTWLPTASTCDVVIDVSPSYGGITESIVDALVSSEKVTSREAAHPKIAFVYISGVWVHGNGTERMTDLCVPGKNAMDIVAWRPAVEQKILGFRDKLDVFIVRPGLLFGYGGSTLGMWWGPIAGAAAQNAAEVSVEAAPEVNATMVHQADLACAMVSLIDRIELLSTMPYPVFDIIGSIENIGGIVKAAARVLNYKGEVKFAEPSQPFTQALNSASNIDGGRAKRYLDWSPKHISVIADIDVYVQSFLASQK